MAFNAICYSNIQFLQLRSVDLPNLFEQAIQLSEVKKQDIKKAEAELNKVKVEVDTRIKSADFQKSVIINIAEGEAAAILQQNIADISSLQKVQNAQSEGYKQLKTSLDLTNKELLSYIKAKIIKGYEGEMALNVRSPVP
jgi:hypothetical protein